MARKILESCPSCGGELEIRELRCGWCETEIRSYFKPCDFCRLSEEQSTFLRLFVTSRGNLSDVEKRLGVSYPTVRAKLDEVIARLAPAEPRPASPSDGAAPTPDPDRRAVLEAVARGELSPAEAAQHLRARGGTRS
ncbi:MAG TPA: DUF2089 domain-containing protein [Chloroflexota bacterium]|jgi:hypothetical protein